jgi:RsiW-degrading membrane proteinase PrsW (M82 family)
LAVPAAFVAYFYDRERERDRDVHGDTPFDIVTLCFVVGGVIGTVAAGTLEFTTLKNPTAGSAVAIGFIEESAKLIFPIGLYIWSRYRSESDGLLFGVSCGMGFAALETMGYGFVSLLRSQGDVATLQGVLMVRGLLSPLGHAAWTGLACAALWYSRTRTSKALTQGVIWTFLLVVALHSLWDLSSLASNAAITYTGYAGLGVVSLSLLVFRLRQAGRIVTPPVVNTPKM